MRIISVSNQKGGVGKSTFVINVGSILGEWGYRSLIIDVDPQHNTTFGLGFKSSFEKEKTVYECITEELPIKDAVIMTPFKNVDLVPSSIKLADAELEISVAYARENLLKDSITASDVNYDFIFLDHPPSLGLLHVNGLVAATEIIIPVGVGPFPLEGINQLQNSIKKVKKKLNTKLDISGVVLNMYNRNNLSTRTYAELEEIFGERLFKNVIRSTPRIGEAQEQGMPINYYNKDSIGAEDFLALAKEVLDLGS